MKWPSFSRQLSDAEVTTLYSEGVAAIGNSGYVPGLGDANGDKVVDDEDASILAAHWKQSVSGETWSQGDFNNDNVVDEKDASILASHWGNTYTEGMAAVPEPSTIALLLGALVSLALLRRK